MSRFDSIENKLAQFADSVNAQLTEGRKVHQSEAQGYEQRQIRWTQDEINRMVLITQFPFEETSDKDGATWNFINLAWLNNSSSSSIPMWEKYLVYKGHFKLIATHIDELLRKSKENLTNIQLADLKKSKTRRGERKAGLQK